MAHKIAIRLINGKTKTVSSHDEARKWMSRGLAYGYDEGANADFVCSSSGIIRKISTV